MRSEIGLLLLCGLSLATAGCDRRSGGEGQGKPDNAATGVTSGEVAPSAKSGAEEAGAPAGKIDRSHKGEGVPAVTFSAAGNKDVSLKDFKGKPLLVNLWATWCGPCIAEMPALDRTAEVHAKDGLQVVAVSQDMDEEERVVAFFKARKLPHLALYRDPENQLGFHYATGLLPTTVLYDRQGKEIARIAGAMDWTGVEAEALIAEALK